MNGWRFKKDLQCEVWQKWCCVQSIAEVMQWWTFVKIDTKKYQDNSDGEKTSAWMTGNPSWIFKGDTPLKTNMTGWNIPIFNRKYIDSFMGNFAAIVMLGFKGDTSWCIQKFLPKGGYSWDLTPSWWWDLLQGVISNRSHHSFGAKHVKLPVFWLEWNTSKPKTNVVSPRLTCFFVRYCVCIIKGYRPCRRPLMVFYGRRRRNHETIAGGYGQLGDQCAVCEPFSALWSHTRICAGLNVEASSM